MNNIRTLLLLTFALTACDKALAPPPTSVAAVGARMATAAPLRVEPLALPLSAAAAQPDLLADDHGRVLLSWVEPQGDGHVLKYAIFVDNRWNEPQTIAAGDDWFVNWADTPHLAITPDGALWAHWLQKAANSSYAYDVMLVRSADGGRSWSPPLRVNDDGNATEHGFASLWPGARDALGIAWLDGRESTDEEAHAGHSAHDTDASGAMTLRTTTFDAQLQRHDETRLDAMTCDCCQTDVAVTARGPLLVYRDRTPEEVRDIAVTRQQHGTWTPAHVVNADRWTMPGCPVNGPAVAAQGDEVLVGWYTAAGNVPTLKLARSSDAGDTFAAPVVVDRGDAMQGRIDVALDHDAAWVLWLREDSGGQSLQLARYARDLSDTPQHIEVARLQGRGRGTGFPQLVVHDGTPHVVWTDIVAGKPQLHAAVIHR